MVEKEFWGVGSHFKCFLKKKCLSVCLPAFFWDCRRTRLRSNDLVYSRTRLSVLFVLQTVQDVTLWIIYIYFRHERETELSFERHTSSCQYLDSSVNSWSRTSNGRFPRASLNFSSAPLGKRNHRFVPKMLQLQLNDLKTSAWNGVHEVDGPTYTNLRGIDTKLVTIQF